MFLALTAAVGGGAPPNSAVAAPDCGAIRLFGTHWIAELHRPGSRKLEADAEGHEEPGFQVPQVGMVGELYSFSNVHCAMPK
ncbi:hypothetical protein GGQ99_002383 [Aminobacter niigataensis]|uniref:Uncharacterized protein n=1 Tax=Aminobacter niigataensis TaxID=83265 RepID=A0ABR6L1E4_9HYPH|nr:hypothetical protein [Aminobacter niigataensis]